MCCLQETHFRPQDTYRQKMRGWKNIFYANGKQKKAGVAILISDKIDLKIKKITRDKEGHYIMIKGSIQEEDKTFRKPGEKSLQQIWKDRAVRPTSVNSSTEDTVRIRGQEPGGRQEELRPFVHPARRREHAQG